MTCPRCGCEAIDTDLQCPQCAYQFAEVSDQTPTFIPCPKCGKNTYAHDLYCGWCGNDLRSVSASTDSEKNPLRAMVAFGSPKMRGRLFFVGIATLGYLGFMVILAYFSLRGPSGHTQNHVPVVTVEHFGGNSPTVDDSGAIDPDQVTQRLSEAGIVGGGDLEVSLVWNTTTDLDVEMRDPFGSVIGQGRNSSSSSGYMDICANSTNLNEEGVKLLHSGRSPGAKNVLPDVKPHAASQDATDSTNGSNQENDVNVSLTKTPIEHITIRKALIGDYTVSVACFWWRERNKTPLPYTVYISSCGHIVDHVSGKIGPENYCANGVKPVDICRIHVN